MGDDVHTMPSARHDARSSPLWGGVGGGGGSEGTAVPHPAPPPPLTPPHKGGGERRCVSAACQKTRPIGLSARPQRGEGEPERLSVCCRPRCGYLHALAGAGAKRSAQKRIEKPDSVPQTPYCTAARQDQCDDGTVEADSLHVIREPARTPREPPHASPSPKVTAHTAAACGTAASAAPAGCGSGRATGSRAPPAPARRPASRRAGSANRTACPRRW